MKMRVNREKFLHCLESVQPGLCPRGEIEQSSCFVFKGGEVLTFNDEICCRSKSGLDKTFEGAVKGEKFLELLRKLPEEEISVDVVRADDETVEIIVIGKGRRSGFRMEEEVTLPVDAVEKPTKWKELHKDFSDAINMVQRCAGHDES